MNVDLNIKGDIEVLRLRPGDTIVVTVDDDRRLSPEQCEEIVAQLRELFPGYEIVCTCGISLAVQREEVLA